jgi:hypothetical protein
MKLLSVAILVATLFPACLRTKVQLEDTVGAPVYEQSHNFFLWGLTPSEKLIGSSEICGRGRTLTTLESKTTFVDGLLTVITLGILSPKTLTAKCT